MATYLLFGKYDGPAVKEISAARTQEAKKVLKEAGGELREAFALLGEYDLLFLAELPNVEAALKASVNLAKRTGICFKSAPAISVEQFDRLFV